MSDDKPVIKPLNVPVYKEPTEPPGVSLPRCDALPPRPFSRSALAHISKRCARAWQVCPIDFNPKQRLLVVAVHDAKQAEVMRKRFEFLLRPVEITFTLTSREEIHRSILRYYEGRLIETSVSRSRSTVKRGSPTGQHGAPAALFDGGRPRLHIPRRRISEEDRDYRADFRRSLDGLLSAVKPLIEHELRAEPEALAAVRLMAWRWRQLARRVGLLGEATDSGALMIWLAPLSGTPELLSRIRMPFEWSHLLWVNEESPSAAGGDVVDYLRLLDAFSALEAESQKALTDPLYVMSELGSRVVGADDHALRAMSDLVGDGLLDPPIELSTSILVVDPAARAGDELVTELSRAGLSVSAVPVTDVALALLAIKHFDVVICAVDQLGSSGHTLCRMIHERTNGDAPVIFMMTSSKDDVAAALRGGADEVLELPMTPDLLWVKLQRALENRAARPDKLSGSFAQVSFSDTIQILCASGRDSVVNVESGTAVGSIYVQAGTVIHAETGELTGADAFYEIMRWTDGVFTSDDLAGDIPRTIDVALMGLLMEGSRRADEGPET